VEQGYLETWSKDILLDILERLRGSRISFIPRTTKSAHHKGPWHIPMDLEFDKAASRLKNEQVLSSSFSSVFMSSCSIRVEL
jgi:hypothetical protein